MKNKIFCFLLLSICMIFQINNIQSQQSWKQFRGPDRAGISYENSIPDQWPENGPTLLWKKELGAGFSEVTVEGNRIYSMFSEHKDSIGLEFIAAFEAKSGTEVWRAQVDSIFFDQFGDGPRSTPVVGKENIFCISSYGNLTALNKSDGKLLWQVNLVSSFGSTVPRWGFSTSPVLIGDHLIIEAGGTESRAFIGFDKETGEVAWTKGEGISSYSSPVVAEIDGESNIIFANQTKLFSLNEKGDTLWTYSMKMNGPMSMPVFFDSNKIFVSTVRSRGFSILEVNDHKVTEILTSSNMKNDYSSSVYYDGYIYGFNVAALQCISAETGETKWTKRGFGKGSLILVGDKLMVLSDKGKLIQLKASPEAYTEQGSFQAIEGKSWTAPSFANGIIYLRNLSEMACYSFK